MVGIMQKSNWCRSIEGGEWDRYEIDIEDNGILGIHQQEQVSPKRRPLTV